VPRRSFLFLLFVLCFGLSVPALAVQGQRGGINDGGDIGQGGGPPTTSATATTAATITTTSNANGNGQGGGAPTTAATTTGNGNGQGGGPPTTTATTTGNGQGGGPPTTTATTIGNGQGSGSLVTTATTTGNGQGNGNGQGDGNSSDQSATTPPRTATTARHAPIADPVATNDDTGRVATFLAASQIPVETDTGSAPPSTSEGQSAPERMISWLLTGNEQRFLPIVASPFVALIVVGRALTSAGSGAIAPLVLLGAVGFTKLLDRRRAKGLVPIAFLP
jgi:hypothetical protein